MWLMSKYWFGIWPGAIQMGGYKDGVCKIDKQITQGPQIQRLIKRMC